MSVKNSLRSFIDIRFALKARFPYSILIALAYIQSTAENWESEEKKWWNTELLCFSQKCVKCRYKEYIFSRHPNKRFSITQNERKEGVISFLKNSWTTGYWFVKNTVLNQLMKELTRRYCIGTRYMPKKKTKENYMLSR